MSKNNPTANRAIKLIQSHSMMNADAENEVLFARGTRARKPFASVKPITTKVALLNGTGWRYRVSRMKTNMYDAVVQNPIHRYPRGRWTGSSEWLDADESALVNEAKDRLTAMLEAVAVTPPFMTAMDCPMPDAA